jgi:hypothetical protein
VSMEELSPTARSMRGEALHEYYVVQDAIRDYDNRSFQIKSWSITLISAAAAGGLTQNAPSLFALAAVASFGFWLVDALWKSFQVVWLARGTELEKLLSTADPIQYAGPAIHARFHKRFKSPISWLYVVPCMFRANVYLPHLPASVGMALFYWWSVGLPGLQTIWSMQRGN